LTLNPAQLRRCLCAVITREVKGIVGAAHHTAALKAGLALPAALVCNGITTYAAALGGLIAVARWALLIARACLATHVARVAGETVSAPSLATTLSTEALSVRFTLYITLYITILPLRADFIRGASTSLATAALGVTGEVRRAALGIIEAAALRAAPVGGAVLAFGAEAIEVAQRPAGVWLTAQETLKRLASCGVAQLSIGDRARVVEIATHGAHNTRAGVWITEPRPLRCAWTTCGVIEATALLTAPLGITVLALKAAVISFAAQHAGVCSGVTELVAARHRAGVGLNTAALGAHACERVFVKVTKRAPHTLIIGATARLLCATSP
jgi:hypothetical protein